MSREIRLWQLLRKAKYSRYFNSDTTSAILSFISYELCKNPKVQAKLRNIIDTIKPEKSFLDVDDVANCAYLDGVINEALRIHPAVRAQLNSYRQSVR